MLEFLSMGELKKEDLKSVVCIQHRDMKIWLGVNQEFELSPSEKTIYIVQYNDKKDTMLGKKGFRVASCLFYTEIAI